MKTSVFVTLSIVLMSFHVVLAQDVDQATKKYLEDRVSAYSKDYPGVSVTVIKGESVLWRKSVGKSDLQKNVAVTSDTKFNIYSTSKYITGLAYLKLVLDEKVSLDQKITAIDPDLPKEYENITIEHLLTHTSGIRHYKGGRDWLAFASLDTESPAEAMAFFINDPLKGTPGEKEVYTTFGMVVASHLLEKITGKRFENAVNDLLPFSNPLELDGVAKNKAVNYVKKGKRTVAYPGVNAKSKYGGGGFIASSDQLAEAGQMLFNEKLAPLKEIKKRFKSQWKEGAVNGIAFGTGAGISSKSFNRPDVLYIAMGGGSPGGRSYLFVVADLQISVAITANLEGNGEDAYALALAIIKKITNIE